MTNKIVKIRKSEPQSEGLLGLLGVKNEHLDALQAQMLQYSRAHSLASAKEFTSVKAASSVGKMVRTVRKSMNMTQQAFADFAGVGRRFVSELEAGKPTLEFERVLKVCQAAGIDLIAVKR